MAADVTRRARQVAARRVPDVLRALEQWLAIPSVSADPAGRGDVRRAARWLQERLGAAGATVRTVPSGPAPLVVARFTGRCTRGSGRAPLVVVYGHYDVQPAGPGWTSPPFRATRRGDRLVARGASDDKGQLMAHVAALEAWQEVGGPPCDVLLLAEGAEEVGSPGLAAALATVAPPVLAGGRPVVVVVSDTRRAGARTPSVTVSQRGVLQLDVLLETGGPPVHAGRYAGALVDPGPLLGELLAHAARDLSGLRAALSAAGVELTQPSDAALRATAGGRAAAGRDLAERSTVRGALVATELRSGGTGGALPPVATARLDVRLPPGVDPDLVRPWLGQLLARRLPDDVRLTVIPGGATRGLSMPPTPLVRRAVEAACLAGYGRRPAYVRSGGSIPAVAHLAQAFGVCPLLLGLGPVADGAHGPDEHVDLRGWAMSVDTSVALAANLGRNLVRRPAPPSPARASHVGRDRGRAAVHLGGGASE